MVNKLKIIKKIYENSQLTISNWMKKVALIIFSFITPLFAGAAVIKGNNFKEIIESIAGFLNEPVIPTLVGLSLLWFLFGLAQFIRSAGNSEAIEEGKKKMLYGVVGLFVIVSIWGLVGILKNTFEI